MITKRTRIMLVVLVLVAIGAYAYLYWWSRTPIHGVLDTFPVVSDLSNKAAEAVIRRPAPAVPAPETPSEDPKDDRTAYRSYANTEFGFSFEYPESWTVSQTALEGKTTLCLREKEGTGGCLATVALEKEGVNASADKTLAALRADYRAGRISESAGRVGGVPATMLRVSGYPAGGEDSTRAAVLTREFQVYAIESAAGQEAVFDRITGSFRFQD